jgi:hypothetical protein
MSVEAKRLAYNEAVWAVKEIDFIEDNRKLQLRIGSSTINHAALIHSNSRTGIGQLGQGHRRHGGKTKAGSGMWDVCLPPADFRIILQRRKRR